MNRSLFENDCYTPDAHELSGEVEVFLGQIIAKWSDKGFGIREIALVCTHAVMTAECDAMLEKARVFPRRDGSGSAA